MASSWIPGELLARALCSLSNRPLGWPCHILCPVLLLSRSTGQMCKFCGCAQGPAQHSLLFLEIIGDLLEKQETLGLLVYVLTFLFLFLNPFHLSQPQVVLRVFLLSPAFPAPSCAYRVPLARATFFPLPNHCCGQGAGLGDLGNRCLGHVCSLESGFPAPAVLPSAPLLPHLYHGGWTGNRVVSEDQDLLQLADGGDVAGKGNPSSLLGQNEAGGTLRSHFIYGDTEAERSWGLSKGPRIDRSLIREEEREGGGEVWVPVLALPQTTLP